MLIKVVLSGGKIENNSCRKEEVRREERESKEGKEGKKVVPGTTIKL